MAPDCDFYYFKPKGKWKYHGEGMFPDNDGIEGYYEVDHDTVYKKNGGMPGIVSDGKDMVLVVIPKPHCSAKYAYPRMILAPETDDE